MDPLLRDFVLRDEAAVRDLNQQALSGTGAELPDAMLDDLMDVSRAYVDAGGAFLVACTGERLVAMGGLQPLGPETAEIRRMRVHPDHQRMGLGRLVLSALEERATALGFKRLELETTGLQTAAQRLYEGAGYALSARRVADETEILRYGKNLY